MYVLQFKKNLEVSILSDSTATVNRTITFCPKMQYNSMTCRGMIPRRVNKKSAKTWLPGVAYPGETDLPGFDTQASQSRRGIKPGESWDQFFHKISQGSHTPARLTRRGIKPRRVSLPGYATPLSQSPGVCDPGESLMTPESQQPFLYIFA